jgi:molecular chaperone GrpE
MTYTYDHLKNDTMHTDHTKYDEMQHDDMNTDHMKEDDMQNDDVNTPEREDEVQNSAEPKEDAAYWKETCMRLMAEQDNARKRLERDKEDHAKYVLTRFAREVVSIADNLELALQTPCQEDQARALHQGVQMTLNELWRILEQFSIMRIQAQGCLFDPHKHQVVNTLSDATVAPQTVLQVLQTGYKIHDRLLRPSLVVVASA